LGYSTLYGDLAGALSPLGDVTKPEVYELARFINRDHEVIPRFVIERAPSAELRFDQVDPFDYPRIAPLVEATVRGDELPSAVDQVEARTLRARIAAAEHKRWQAGVILKVSEKSFGTGRMMPIAG